MKMTKRKLKEVYNYALSVINRKENQELRKLGEWYEKEKKKVLASRKAAITTLLVSGNFQDVSAKIEYNWNRTSYWVNAFITEEQYRELMKEQRALDEEYNKRFADVKTKYSELRKKLSQWYDETYKQIIFGEKPELPDWLVELLDL